MDQQNFQQPIEQSPPERKPFFNIKQPPPEQPIEQSTEPEPKPEKNGWNWKNWLITIVILIIAMGLGYYFLFR